MISDQGTAGEEDELVRLINIIIAEVQNSKEQSRLFKSRLLSDIDFVGEALGKISLDNFDIEVPPMRVPEMDTVGIGILDMEKKLKEGHIAREEKEKALRDVKVLRGLIPICSSCKKIRDSKGYWQKVEEYIREHSEAEFSHGLCLDCIKELYPELLDEKGEFK